MKASKTTLTQASISLLVCSCLILVGMGIWYSRAGRAQEFVPRIVNKTSALRVVSSNKNTISNVDTLELVLRNDSNKNITAVTLLYGQEGVSTTIDYAFSEELLTPGKTVVQNIPLNGLQSAAARNNQREADVTIAAVYFDDQNGDGDSEYISRLKDKYSGVRDQVQQILAQLRQALKSSPQKIDLIRELQTQAALLQPETGYSTRSPDYKRV